VPAPAAEAHTVTNIAITKLQTRTELLLLVNELPLVTESRDLSGFSGV
jgi:hypothetical protein